ncbi:MAG: TonB-dependent receptor [Candidatus Spyradosoma sp.]
MQLRQSFLIFAGAVMLSCVPALADDAAPAESETNENAVPAPEEGVAEPEMKTGKAVRVTAAKHEMEMADVPMSVSVVEGDAVTKSAAATVADLLEDVPGVQVESTGSAGFKQVNIRGESNQRVLVLVDGQKISETKGMNGAPLLISVQDIERAEVIKGPASVLYGSEAIGGVVNIITKKSGEEGVHGSAGVRGDTGTRGLDQYYDLNARYGDFSARVSWSDEDHGDIESPDGRVKNTDWRFQNASAYLAYDVSKKATLGAKFESFRGRSNVYTGSEDIRMSLPDWDREKAALFLEVKDVSDTFVKFRLDAYAQKTEKRFLQDITTRQTAGPMNVNVNVDADRLNTHYSYGAEAQADFAFGEEHYLIVGAQLDYVKLDSDEATTTYGTMTNAMSGTTSIMADQTTFNRYKADVLTAALFAQDEWNFAEGWELVLGARGTYVKNELDRKRSRLVNRRRGTDTTTDDPSASDEDANATFSASLVNSQLEDWTFRATVAQGYRYASVNELYVGSAMASSVTHANPDLDPEKSVSYELGARYERGGAKLDATLFYTDSRDYIGTRTTGTGTGDEVWFVNYDSAKSFGAELAASWAFELGRDATLTPYAVATFLRRRFESESGSTYNTGQPELFGKLGVRGAYSESNRDWWADFNMRANSASKENVENSDGSVSVERTAGWATFNFSFGVDITPERRNPYFSKLTLALGVDNIADTRYELPNLSYAQPGRSYWVSLKYEF